jgi:hypothetical protein
MAALMGHVDEDIPMGLTTIGTAQSLLARACGVTDDVNDMIDDEKDEGALQSPTSPGNDLVLAVGRSQPRARFIPDGPLAALASPSRALSPRSDHATSEQSSSSGYTDSIVRLGVAFVCSEGMPSRSGPVCFCARGSNKPLVRVNPSGQVNKDRCAKFTTQCFQFINCSLLI